ncbi:hypothetical protein [Capnocytophaga bilenii]|uniref:hypothetical protein n=1 Tax=Capnocytophaga bilenii TaxID=2819369 RepID=UPI0028D34C48|nr:hypothetical protein [Capnocytophaga bilenii]
MNKENYPTWLVSPDIAKELKEIGFDTPCYCYIALAISGKGYQCIEIGDRIHNEVYNIIELRELKCINYNKQKGCISLPSWEQALAWFREKGYYGNLEATSKGTSAYIYVPFLDQGTSWDIAYKESYEEVREILLLKLIDIYKISKLK